MRLFRSSAARAALLGVSFALVMPAAAAGSTGARPLGAGQFRRPCGQAAAGRGQRVVHPDDHRQERRTGRPRRRPGSADVPAGIAVRAVLQGFPQPQPPGPRRWRRWRRRQQPARGAAGAEPRVRLHRRPVGLRGHQQPRHRRRRRGLRHAAGQHDAEGRDRRARRERRHRAAEGEVRQAAADGRFRRFGAVAGRRLGAGDRQPVRPGRHGDGGHRLGARPRHPSGPVRRLHPDRRGDQPRQLRRPAVQHGRPGHRHQHGDLLAVGRVDRHRLLHPVQHGEEHRLAVEGSSAIRGAAGWA